MINNNSDQLTVAGRITGVFGIKGWLKVVSFTEPEKNLFRYRPWLVRSRSGLQCLELRAFQMHKNGWIVQLEGLSDRTAAEAYKLLDIMVDQRQFDELDEGDFYWHQLVGLKVFSAGTDLGRVSELLETGANDVLVVRPDSSSIDDRERLIPYVPGRFVEAVDLRENRILVNWHVDD